jgi:4-amino-4-deoxy-L-arabinose transferase-like glycosyltransferase
MPAPIAPEIAAGTRPPAATPTVFGGWSLIDVVETRLAFVICLATLFIIRAVLAAKIPLAYDEAYYWAWSQSLSAGYYDHPPMVALLIRFGTLLGGDTELAIRLGAVLLAVPMTWAVAGATQVLFKDIRLARLAAFLFNLTLLVVGVGIIVTPDTPLLFASCLVLLFLANIAVSGRAEWWIAVGAACGIALLSKYTAIVFGVEIAIWLGLVPSLRHWYASLWLYAGGVVALLIFSGVVIWNANHQFASFSFQFGRLQPRDFNLQYFVEMLPAQMLLMTPPIFVLGAAGLIDLTRSTGNGEPGKLLIPCLVWPLLVYGIFHSMHGRVEGNWLVPIYPAVAVAAAYAMWQPSRASWIGRAVDYARLSALPVGFAVFLVLSGQFLFESTRIPYGTLARKVAYGWPSLTLKIRDLIAQTGAAGIITSDYHTAAWLRFYMGHEIESHQINERIRWVNLPGPSRQMLEGPVLYLDGGNPLGMELDRLYANRKEVGVLVRADKGITVDTFRVYVLSGLTADPQAFFSQHLFPK